MNLNFVPFSFSRVNEQTGGPKGDQQPSKSAEFIWKKPLDIMFSFPFLSPRLHACVATSASLFTHTQRLTQSKQTATHQSSSMMIHQTPWPVHFHSLKSGKQSCFSYYDKAAFKEINRWICFDFYISVLMKNERKNMTRRRTADLLVDVHHTIQESGESGRLKVELRLISRNWKLMHHLKVKM